MNDTARNVLLFVLGVGLALLIYFIWKRFNEKNPSACGCGGM